MKKIFIAIHYLELGGAEMSLLGLLDSLDYSENEVDLFLYSHRGELIGYLPKEVNLLPEIPEYARIERPIKDVLREGYLRIALARLKARARFKRYRRRVCPSDGTAQYSYISNSLVPVLPEINPGKEYDVAVSFLMPHDYVLRKVRAKKKVAWIHTDYSMIDVDTALEAPVWSAYDTIVSISKGVTKGFLSKFPALEGKIVEIPNRIPETLVKSKADEIPLEEIRKYIPDVPGRVNLLSVGRFSYAKNFDNVPAICRRVREAGIDAYWYLVGYGETEGRVREKIAEAGMQDYVVILGKKENPYPFMKACDVYVQPSRYEGDPMTVKEASALGKKVIVTAFPTSGCVAESLPDCAVVPMDKAGCAAGIVSVIRESGIKTNHHV